MTTVHRCKCLIIGDSTVGKSSIARVVSNSSNAFPNKYVMTTDIDISVKLFKIPNSDKSVELFLFDCSGKEFYRQIHQKVWSNDFQIIVAVFDVTNEQSLNSLHNWLSEAMKTINREKVIGIVVSNKTDLKDRQLVSSDDGLQLAKKFKMRHFECSAKDNRNIEEAFLHLVGTWLESQHNQDNSLNHQD